MSNESEPFNNKKNKTNKSHELWQRMHLEYTVCVCVCMHDERVQQYYNNTYIA